MAAIDWIIVFVYASATIAMGWWLGRKSGSTGEYFIGSGRMNPILIGVSLFATLLSTITYLAIPGEIAGKGPVYLINFAAYPLVFLIVAFVILPVYMRHRVTSAYELLEHRLGLSIRLLGATLFLLLRLVWMALLIFMTSKAIAYMIGADDSAIPYIVLVTGIFSITYTSLGGLRAVVVTDLMQTLLLYGGAVLVIATVTWQMGGFGWFPTEWQGELWDEQPLFSLDPSTRITVIGTLLSVTLWMVCTSAGDQVTVQRFMSTADASKARRAVAMQLSVGLVVGLTLGLVGLALLGYFQANPQALPVDGSLSGQADQLFPRYIANHLPPVVSGFVVAGLFAAAMSSIDSGVNSITAVVTTDFLKRFGKGPKTDRGSLRFARILAFAIGAVVVLLSTTVGSVPGNFMAVTQKTVNLLTVPIALLFFFALYVPFANAPGVWIATVCSVAAASLVSFSGLIFGMHPVTGNDPVSFQWIGPVALVTGIGIGLPACKLAALCSCCRKRNPS